MVCIILPGQHSNLPLNLHAGLSTLNVVNFDTERNFAHFAHNCTCTKTCTKVKLTLDQLECVMKLLFFWGGGGAKILHYAIGARKSNCAKNKEVEASCH